MLCSANQKKYIIEYLGDDHYAILDDECGDVSHKEQLAIFICYVSKVGKGCQRFLAVVHLANTTSLSLKSTIESLLTAHNLNLNQICGQGYDGASNMERKIKELNIDHERVALCLLHSLLCTSTSIGSYCRGNGKWTMWEVFLSCFLHAQYYWSFFKRHDML